MISKKLIWLTSALMLSSGLAYAEEEQVAQKDFHVTLSAKAWAHTWNGWQNSSNAGTVSVDQSEIPFIGGATVTYGKFFLSGNYSPETNYDFTRFTGALNGKRKEYDLNFGYYIHPQVALALGYKAVNIHYYDSVTPTTYYDWNYRFPIIGIMANAPVMDTKFFMYGSGAIGIGGTVSGNTASNAKNVDKVEYKTFEAGMGYAITNALKGTVGYKYQEMNAKWKDSVGVLAKPRDTTSGLMLGVSYTF